MQPLLLTLQIPNHNPAHKPDHKAIGKKLDNLLKQHFMGKDVVIRCIGSKDHPDLTLDELTDIIIKTGTDKYNSKRSGVNYEQFTSRGIHIDFYGEDIKITKNLNIMSQFIWEMHHSAIGDRGFSVHVDLVLIYDQAKLDMVMNLYDHHESSDGFVFKDPKNKKATLLGVIKIES